MVNDKTQMDGLPESLLQVTAKAASEQLKQVSVYLFFVCLIRLIYIVVQEFLSTETRLFKNTVPLSRSVA